LDGPSRVWLNERNILPWSKGPPAASLKDPPRKAALQLAEADGAPAWSPKVPATRASTPNRATSDEPQAKRLKRVVSSEVAPNTKQAHPVQAAELRTIIEEAKRKQADLEKQLEAAIQDRPSTTEDSALSEAAAVLEAEMDKVIEEERSSLADKTDREAAAPRERPPAEKEVVANPMANIVAPEAPASAVESPARGPGTEKQDAPDNRTDATVAKVQPVAEPSVPPASEEGEPAAGESLAAEAAESK